MKRLGSMLATTAILCCGADEQRSDAGHKTAPPLTAAENAQPRRSGAIHEAMDAAMLANEPPVQTPVSSTGSADASSAASDAGDSTVDAAQPDAGMLNQRGLASDIADLGAFLASDDARFISCEIISFDAGNCMRGWR